MPALEVVDVSVHFGGTMALEEVALTVEAGTVTGLIGPNGAGKTTLFNVITGLTKPARGRVRIGERDASSLPPSRRARLGLARTFQRLELFTSLTVRGNLRAAGDIRNGWSRSGRIDVRAECDRILDLVGLADVADRDVTEIPTGRARVVEVARALMTRPSILLLDEPASGQTEDETRRFGGLLRRLSEDGLAVCLVEHDMSLVMDVADRVNVLDYGRMLASGPPAQVRTDPAVVAAYLGGSA